MPRKSENTIWRTALPPGVSIVVHGALLTLLVVVGSRIAALEPEPARKVALAELDAAPSTLTNPPPRDTDDDTTPTTPERAPSGIPESGALEQAARELTSAPDASIEQPALSAAAMRELRTQDESLATMRSPSAPAPVTFAGVRTSAAARIVYAVDASGATATSFSYIKERLLQSIDRLSPTQRFQVVLFRQRADSLVELAPIGDDDDPLPRATSANKRAVADWIQTIPAAGRSNPIDALRAAIDLDPDLVLLISRAIARTGDEWAGGLRNVRTTLDEINPADPVTGDRPVVIKTIQLLDDDPTNIMRTIGILHGDGADDYQVVSYNQLTSPDDAPPELDTPATDAQRDQRIASAQRLLTDLTRRGSLLRATCAAPTRIDRADIDDTLARLDPVLRSLDPADPRVTLLRAQRHLLARSAGAPATTDPSELRAALDDAVFLDPDIDARRRIVIAQLTRATGDTDAAANKLAALLDERAELDLAPTTTAHALLALQSLGTTHPDEPAILGSEPFTIADRPDAGMLLLSAQARTHGRLLTNAPDPFAPLLDLRDRTADPSFHALIDDAIVTIVSAAPSDPALTLDEAALPARVRLPVARERLRQQSTREDAIRTLIALADTDDDTIASTALWLACLGASAEHSRFSARALIESAAALAERFPDHPNTPSALAGAIERAREISSPDLEPLLRRAVALAPQRPEIDLWRLELARLTPDHSERERLVRALTPHTRESDLGSELLVAAASSATDPRDLADTLRDLGSPLAREHAIRAARLDIDTDPRAAAGRLAPYLDESPADPETSILFARAELALDRPADALTRLTPLADTLDRDDPMFWRVWTLIIETTIEHGSPADQRLASAHLTRLALIDPKLGPEPFSTRLTRARETLHSNP